MACTVRFENITKIFGKKFIAVDDVSISIEAGKFVTLLGPSGCGKTTSLRMIAGLDRQTSGDIYFNDDNVNNVSTRNREVAMVFQAYALYPHMTAYKNLAYGLKIRKTPKDEIDKKIRAIAEMLGIEDLLNRTPRQMSGGQQQRVALGRAIVRDPKVFLLDEPLSNLDAKLRAKMRTEITTLQKKLGHTMVYVTHDQLEAMSMSDEIILMNNGKVMQVGSPMELFDKPKNMFVAGFIGTPSINFLSASLKEEEEVVRAMIGGSPLDLSDECLAAAQKKGNRKVVIGVRPEYISINLVETPGTVPVKIMVTELVGSEMILHTDLEGNEVVVRGEIILSIEEGQVVWLDFSREKLLLFDPKSEESLNP